MKMPNKHSAPRGRQPARLRDGGQLHAFLGFGGAEDPAEEMYARAERASSDFQPPAPEAESLIYPNANPMQPPSMPTAYPSMAQRFSRSQANPAMTMPDGTGNLLRQQPSFEQRNPGVVQNRIASPGAPKPVAAPSVSPLPTAQTGANSFGDAAAVHSMSTPQTAVHGGMSMQEWSAPGRSTGQPTAETMASLSNVGSSHNNMSPLVRSVAAAGPRRMDPLGAPYRGMKDANFNPNAGSFRAPMPVGLREGGELQAHAYGLGGPVQGKDNGYDSINSKYRPGEYVASKEMLDLDPELKPRLDALREVALAQKGMTPGQADAKAVRGTGLRAVNAYFDDMGEPLGQRAPQSMGAGVSPQAAEGYVKGGQQMGVPRAGAPAAAPLTPAQMAAAAPKPSMPMAAARAGNAVLNSVPGSRVLAGMAAKIAPYAGAATQGLKVAQVGMNPEMTQNDTWTQAAEGVSGIAGGIAGAAAGSALGPLGTLAGGALGYVAPGLVTKGLRYITGQDTSSPIDRMPAQGAAQSTAPAQPAAAQPAAPTEKDPAEANAIKLAAGNVNTAPKLGDIRNVDPGAGTQDIFTQGVWRTVSTPEAKAARGLRDQQFSAKQAQDTANSRADLERQAAYFSKAAGTDGGANEAEMLRGLGPVHRAAAMQKMAETKALLRNADLQANTSLATNRLSNETQLRTTGMNNDTTREGNEMQLRGHMAPILFAQQQRQLAGQMLREAGGDLGMASKMAIARGIDPSHLQSAWTADTSNRTAEQGMGLKAQEQFDKDFSAFDAEGKRNDGLSAARQSAIRKVMPGIDSLSASARSAHMPEAEILGKVFDRLASNPQMGLDKLIKAKGPGHDALPNLKNAKLHKQGYVAGKLTPGSVPNGWYITMPDGTDVPMGDLSGGEIEVLRRATETGSWRKPTTK
jgi:hypothetical protein